MTVWCEEHKRSDCSHELTKLVDELAADNERLHDELTETQTTLNAAMEGRRWQMDRALKAEAENARLTEQLRIATETLSKIARCGCSACGAGPRDLGHARTLADDALTCMSVVE